MNKCHEQAQVLYLCLFILVLVLECHEQAQVLHVIPVPSILRRLPLVPVSATGTIPFAMRREAADFPGAFCDKSGFNQPAVVMGVGGGT